MSMMLRTTMSQGSYMFKTRNSIVFYTIFIYRTNIRNVYITYSNNINIKYACYIQIYFIKTDNRE